MQKFRIEILGREYSLISSPDQNKKPKESEIFLFPTDCENIDFEFDFCDTHPTVCTLIIGYFLLCCRGLPLESLILLSRGKIYTAEREGAYVFTSIRAGAVSKKSALLFGCETAFADIGALRLAIFSDAKRVDERVFSGLLLAGDKTDARRLIVISGDKKGVKIDADVPLEPSELSEVGRFLLSRGVIEEKLRLKYKDSSVFYTYRNGVLKIGVLPKIIK